MLQGQVNTRYDTLENWDAVNPILERGELAVAVDNGSLLMKCGDGATAWVDLPAISEKKEEEEEKPIISALPVGHIYASLNADASKEFGSLKIDGTEYVRSAYADLWTYAEERPSIVKTEEEWQALYESNNGNVPYFSSGDGTTFRVPSIHCWIKGGSADDVGTYLSAGLPNIEGVAGTMDDATYKETSGAFYKKSDVKYDTANTTNYNGWFLAFDASLSNPIYGNSDTVQPESVALTFYIRAFGSVSNIGNQDIADLSSQVSANASAITTKLENTTVHVIKTYHNGPEWYRIYSDGWCEQGSEFAWSGAWTKMSFILPFANSNEYNIVGQGYRTDGSPYQQMTCFKDYAVDSCSVWSSDDTTSNEAYIRWRACGYVDLTEVDNENS